MPAFFKVELNGVRWYYNVDVVIRVGELLYDGGTPYVLVAVPAIQGETQTVRVVGEEARRLEQLVRERYARGSGRS